MYTIIAYIYIEHLLGKLTHITSQSSQQSVMLVLLVFPFPLILGHQGLILPQGHINSQELNLKKFDPPPQEYNNSLAPRKVWR